MASHFSRGTFLKALGRSLVPASALKTVELLAKAAERAVEPRPHRPRVSPGEGPEGLVPPVPKIVSSVPEAKAGRRIALTFDDGPTPDVTDEILDLLQERMVRATFFMIGEQVKRHPEMAKRVFDAGHEVGNHTFTHAKLTELSDTRLEQELIMTQDAILQATGFSPRWMRPPFGALRKNQEALVAKAGFFIALWSVDSLDWKRPEPSEIIRTVVDQVTPGSLVLCHDVPGATVTCLGDLLDQVLALEFEPVTLSELMK